MTVINVRLTVVVRIGETRDAVPGPVQTGPAAGRDDDRAANGGDAELSDRADGDAAVLPTDEHAEDVRHGTGGPEQRGVQRQRQFRLRDRRRHRRRRRRSRHGVYERQREPDGTHHVASVRRHDTHEEAQWRRPVQNRVSVCVCYDNNDNNNSNTFSYCAQAGGGRIGGSWVQVPFKSYRIS